MCACVVWEAGEGGVAQRARARVQSYSVYRGLKGQKLVREFACVCTK